MIGRGAVLAPPALDLVPDQAIVDAVRGRGLWLDVGAVVLRVRSDSDLLAEQLAKAYPAFTFCADGEWADIHVSLFKNRGWRRWLDPRVSLADDGGVPLFVSFPADSPLPLFEWGCNWLIGERLNHLLLLHAGAVERDGLALVMPALPGSGKSTLTAALSLSGWRLLSDEFGAYDSEIGAFRPLIKPTALKNASIDVIRRFSETARLGPEFPNTHKGTVAHLAALPEAVARRHEPARPGAFVLPRWSAGSATRLEPLPAERLFPALAFNAFNYRVQGALGFQAVTAMVAQCPAWQLTYSDLSDALAALDAIWPQVRDRHGAVAAGAGAW